MRFAPEKLKKLLDNGPFSATRIAAQSGISKQYLSMVKLGKQCPSVEILARIADATGQEIGYFFTNDSNNSLNDEAS